ncbi:MAG: AEC family transporter [Verrucomicrobiae bacterium]|nr:AEC family transporter [Verrucomicrobiae bacterium]
MPAYSTILFALVPVFLVMITGAGFQKAGLLSEELETGMMRLSLNLLAPCLIFTKVTGNPALASVATAGWAIGLGLILILVGFGIAFVAAKVGRFRKGEGLRTFTLAAGIQNYGFMALPVVMELWPDDPGPAGLIFVHGMGIELAIWTVGLFIMSHHAGPPWRKLINGPFIAVVVSLVLNYSGAHVFVPEVVKTAMKWLGDCSIPMALFMIGATIGRFLRLEFWGDALRVFTASLAARIILHPIAILAAAKYLSLPVELQKVLVVQAGMPAAVFPIVIARLYGGHPQTAIQVVLATTLASVVTAPLVIALGIWWVGF